MESQGDEAEKRLPKTACRVADTVNLLTHLLACAAGTAIFLFPHSKTCEGERTRPQLSISLFQAALGSVAGCSR